MVSETSEGVPQSGDGQAQGPSLLELGKGRITETLYQTTEAIRETGRRMDEQGASPVSRFASRAAESLDRAAQYVSDAQPRAVMRDINGFARRQPEVFLGGALLAGVILGRFLRSRPPEDRQFIADDGYTAGSTPEPEHEEYTHGV